MSQLSDYLFYEEPGITLYCGDCREVLPLLRCPNTTYCLEECDGRCAGIDFIFTDPPYGHNNNDGDLISNRENALGRPRLAVRQGQARPIAQDSPAEVAELIPWLFRQFNDLLASGACCCCCCCGGGPGPQFARWSLWLDEAVGFKHMIVWDKGPMGMGWHYRRSYETILVGQKKGGPCRWYDESNRIENIIRHIPKIIPASDQHPTEKPVALAAHFITLHSKPGDVVLDPFAGGGSTLRAAKDLGRRAIGIEIEPKYCEIAVKRLRQEILL